MIIIPELTWDRLNLKAYSYQNSELNVIDSFLTENRFDFHSEDIDRDKHDRKGLLFRIAGLFQIERFERELGVRFKQKDTGTDVDFEEGEGSNYRCIRIAHLPWKKGCADITANGEHAAFIKCSLLANKKNWFGVQSERGKCKNA